MSITTKARPEELTPAFNQVVFIMDSTNKNAEAFRYVVDVYLSGTSTKLFETRIAPRFGDGYAFIRIDKELQSRIKQTFDLANKTSLDAAGSFVKIDLKVGEEFVNSWSYDDYEFRSGNKTALNGTTAHGLAVGDQIKVSQTDGGALKPMLEGLFTVTEVPNATEIIIDIDFTDVGSGATMGGAVRYADNRTTITRDLKTETLTAYDMALNLKDFREFDSDLFKLTADSTTNKLLTDLPDNFYTSDSALMFINFGQFESSEVSKAWFQNDSGTTYSKSVVSGAAKMVRQFAAGAGNLEVSGSTIVTPSTLYYDFWLTDASNNQLTKKYRVWIKRECFIEEIEILFRDRKGSLIPFYFNLRAYESGEIKRETYRKQLGDYSSTSGTYTYLNEDAGEETISVDVKKRLQITTAWLNEEMSLFFEQLLTSKLTLMRVRGVYYSVICEETGFKTEVKKNKRMIKKTITVRYSNDEPVNA